MTTLYRRFLFGILVLGVLSGLLVDIWRRNNRDFDPLQFVRRPADVQTRDDAKLLSGWIDKVDNGWEVGKNHERVRSAFEKIVADARRSTVRIFQSSSQVAMGTIVDADGHIMSKASEISEDDRILCQLHDGRRRSATIVGKRLDHDLVMLQVKKTRDLKPVRWYAESEPIVGSLLATPHLGDAPLAIGVVSLRKRDIPNNGVLGITLTDTPNGPYVNDVIKQSAAEEVGLKRGDVVTQVDTEPVTDSAELVNLIGKRLPGDEVVLKVRRGQDNLTVPVLLGRRADLDPENTNFQNFIGGELSFRRSGFNGIIQHDTFLLPEHCGGPVVDLNGRVIGINIARAERIASFALPASTIISCIADLKSGTDGSLAQNEPSP